MLLMSFKNIESQMLACAVTAVICMNWCNKCEVRNFLFCCLKIIDWNFPSPVKNVCGLYNSLLLDQPWYHILHSRKITTTTLVTVDFSGLYKLRCVSRLQVGQVCDCVCVWLCLSVGLSVPYKLRFGVKFYAADPCKLFDEISRCVANWNFVILHCSAELNMCPFFVRILQISQHNY